MKVNILYLFVLLGFLSACSDDFMDATNPNQISDGSFWSSKSDAVYALAGCYDVLQSRPMYGGGVYNSGIRDHDCFGDNSYNAWEWMGLEPIADGTTDATNWFLSEFWTSAYTGIARCNNLIENVPTIETMSEDDINTILGEAKFLRALYHFNLVNGFGEVPLILESQTVETAHIAKSSVREIYDAIIDDLKFAADHIGSVEFGHASQSAAHSLLAKVYLYDGKFTDAAASAKQVIDLGQHSLFADYSTLFTPDNEVNSEIVFSVRFQSGLADNNGEGFSGTWAKVPQTHHQPMPNFVNDFYCTDGLSIDKSPLYDASKKNINRDPRLETSILFQGEIWFEGGKPYDKKLKTGYAMHKYIRNTTDYMTDGPQDFYVIRYADVLLMRAEALIESNQITQEVYDLINTVRARVNMPKIEDVEGVGLSESDLRDILRHERRVEFGLEGTRYYDLKRWGTLEEATVRANADNIVGHTMVFNGEKSLYWPLPQVEIDNNKLLEQNPNW